MSIEAFLCSCRGGSPIRDGLLPTIHPRDPYAGTSPSLSAITSLSDSNTLSSAFSAPSQPTTAYIPPLYIQHSQATIAHAEHTCLWNGCRSSFSSLAELVSHVNLSHLNVYLSEHPDPFATSSSCLRFSSEVLGLSCQWDNCVAGAGCGLSFASVDDLMNHLTADHVGSGKNHYECLWSGCERSGEKGFSSKQKVCRHLQMHTGHKPFQCKLCKQHFSEAATLQQHMRRHTQEKPYLCDVPGCGKAFAIAGALTIHRRTHMGLKPFKCKYCERAFSESSNLSKHMRTHTGVRPYVCEEPGCGKAFARPDQFTRHQGVHSRRHRTIGPVHENETYAASHQRSSDSVTV
ncbi:hypothetical protein BJY52DRAFT_1123613 [Lactarius psammicola]|nr:hypothetical protein BJY52DRAFT_1123613 [Lactarius psammicola]